jgi:uncharacterized protein YprB with RNaseH-like and TPR domain
VSPAILDIESTSLHADTGMLVCAVIREKGKDSIFFVESPRREKTALQRLLKKIRRCDSLVTFNGRSFDIPFLVSRGLVLGVPDIGIPAVPHVDIYELCRRSLRFDGLSLDHVARMLGIDFKTEATGREVPHLYLTYLASRSKKAKDRIIGHCVSDVDVLEQVSSKLEAIYKQEEFKP